MNSDQKNTIEQLIKCRDNITQTLCEIASILKQDFPEEYEIAYQYWIPQIVTALRKDNKWLSRGDYSMQQTIDRILDKLSDDKFNATKKIL
jgi:hypothetical protein